jgi:(carboxyethyl)arginine beta-lactam-synthase
VRGTSATRGVHSSLPTITGFTVRVGGPLPVVPVTGNDVEVLLTADGTVLSGRVWGGRPAVATSGGTACVLAGELYHTEALRQALGSAADGVEGDGELLLACWRRYGPAGLRLLDGRFALVLVDGDVVVAATDHAAGVPLHVRRHRRLIDFSTEAKALGRSGASEVVPGTERVPGPVDVLRVRAGTAVVFSAGGAGAMRTWTPPQHRVVMPEQEAVRRLRATLDDAVRSRLDGGPVTVVLSGGIDSSSVAALACAAGGDVETVSLGTDTGDEFGAARLVADHLGTRHVELSVTADSVVRALPRVVAAAEIVDPDVLEYLMPLVVLYGLLPDAGRRVLTGYGADIPLGGMHRDEHDLNGLDALIAADMGGFDGFNELSPALGAAHRHWTTHPFWDRAVLDLLTSLEPGLKRRHGLDKWVLRAAMADLLPETTVRRPKLGIHEGSGVTSRWTALLRAEGVPDARVRAVKHRMASLAHERVVGQAEPPDDVSFDDLLTEALRRDTDDPYPEASS